MKVVVGYKRVKTIVRNFVDKARNQTESERLPQLSRNPLLPNVFAPPFRWRSSLRTLPVSPFPVRIRYAVPSIADKVRSKLIVARGLVGVFIQHKYDLLLFLGELCEIHIIRLGLVGLCVQVLQFRQPAKTGLSVVVDPCDSSSYGHFVGTAPAPARQLVLEEASPGTHPPVLRLLRYVFYLRLLIHDLDHPRYYGVL